MLYNLGDKSENRIQTRFLWLFIKKLVKPKAFDDFYSDWIDVLRETYDNNRVLGERGLPFFSHTVSLHEDCTFRLHFYTDRLRNFAKYYNVEIMTPEEFKSSGIKYKKHITERKDLHSLGIKNPLLIIVDCPFEDCLKPVTADGWSNLPKRLEYVKYLDYVKIPPEQAYLALSQRFEQAWYMFIYEQNEYKKLKTRIERTRYYNASSMHKFRMYSKQEGRT